MIHPLRILHRRTLMVLGVVLPMAFGLGIAARRPVPQMSALPFELLDATPQHAATVWERRDLFTNAPVQVRLLREADRFAIACAASNDFVKPDLLVYWSENPPTTDKLPNDAILLGAFTASALPLPADTANRDGLLVLFSLADQEIIAVSRRIQFNVSTN